MPLLRNVLLMLVAVVLAAAPLARSLGAPVSADYPIQQAGLPDECCCGDASSSPLCGEACAMGGSACMSSAIPVGGPRIGLEAPATLLQVPPVSPAPAPDTAPPKSSSA